MAGAGFCRCRKARARVPALLKRGEWQIPIKSGLMNWRGNWEIKAKVLIDYLPEAGVTEKKTHSSSIDLKHAELVRKHFRGLAAAEEAEAAEKAAKATAAKKPAAKQPWRLRLHLRLWARSQLLVALAPAAPATAAARPGVATHAPQLVRRRLQAPLHALPRPPARRQLIPTTHPTGGSTRGCENLLHPHQRLLLPLLAARPGAAPAVSAPRPGMPLRPAAAPGSAPAGARPAAAAPGTPASSWRTVNFATLSGTSGSAWFCAGNSRRPGAPQGIRRRPAGAVPQQYRPSSAPQGRPGGAPGQRPGGPPSRFPQRPGSGGGPGGRDNKGPVGTQRPGAGVPKAEPGKPLYARKPAARGRPLIEKRYAEGERKLHPVCPRAGAGPGGRATAVEPVAPVSENRAR